jgi:hypothetical protein
MQPWVYVVIFLAVLAVFGFVFDALARRKRKGVDKLEPLSPADRVGQVEHIRPGTSAEASDIRNAGGGGLR